MESGIRVLGEATPNSAEVLPEALALVADLARKFEPERRTLIQARSSARHNWMQDKCRTALSRRTDLAA